MVMVMRLQSSAINNLDQHSTRLFAFFFGESLSVSKMMKMILKSLAYLTLAHQSESNFESFGETAAKNKKL